MHWLHSKVILSGTVAIGRRRLEASSIGTASINAPVWSFDQRSLRQGSFRAQLSAVDSFARDKTWDNERPSRQVTSHDEPQTSAFQRKSRATNSGTPRLARSDGWLICQIFFINTSDSFVE